jgi:hypothetical protein
MAGALSQAGAGSLFRRYLQRAQDLRGGPHLCISGFALLVHCRLLVYLRIPANV